jgi:DNA-binding XRE family transcriptional regulator
MVQKIGNEIEKLRNKMWLNQARFADQFGATAMTVSRWERDVNAIPSRALLRLGVLANKAGMDGWRFWELAGLTRSDARSLLGRSDARATAAGRR